MLWIGGLWPRQIHSSLVVLLRGGRPANTNTASGSGTSKETTFREAQRTYAQTKASLPPAGLTGNRAALSTWGVIVSLAGVHSGWSLDRDCTG